MNYYNQYKRDRNEEGLVSIIVVTIVIIILSLMTIGFAKIMDREFRQSLDRELAVQANYAAESGMNDARNYIASGADVDTAGACLNTDNLTAAQTPFFIKKGGMSDGQVLDKYTCVNIDTNVHDIELKIPRGQSRIVKIITADTLDKLYFSWNNQNAGATTSQPLPNIGNYPTESFWAQGSGNENATGVLRNTIYPVAGDGSASTPGDKNTDLESAARNYFMYPNADATGAPGAVSFGNNGIPVQGNCNSNNYSNPPNALPYKTNGYYCNSAITNLAAVAPPPPPLSSQTKDGADFDSCVITQAAPPGYTSPCLTGPPHGSGPIYNDTNYDITYTFFGIPAGNYNLNLNYGEHIEPLFPSWPPNPCGNYSFNVNIVVTAGPTISNRQLSSCNSSDSINLGAIPANAQVKIQWTNNAFIVCGANPFCNDPNLQINNISLNENAGPPPVAPPNAAFYYVKLTALYRDLSVSIQGENPTRKSVAFKNAQAIIDVTAKGNDVLKRLQGRLSLEPDYDYPQFAVDSMDTLCKRLRLPKTGPNTYGNAAYQDLAAGDPFVNFACSAGSIGGSNVPAM
jgi:hypothetical protein